MPRRSRSRSRERESKRSRHRRSRSRSRDRHHRHERSRSRDRGRHAAGGSGEAGASALQQLQQQQLQKQLLAQQMLLQQQALTGGNLSLSNKKQREIYVGNLTIGVVVDTMLRDLFNGALAHLVPDPVANPPVINAALDPSGRFGFVECRTEELATAGMQLDKVDLCGRHVNVGRPKGYVEPPGGAAAAPKLDLTQMFSGAAAVGLMPGGGLPGSGPMPNMPGGQIAPLPGNTYMSPLPGPPQPAAAPAAPSRLLMLNQLLTATSIWDDQQRQELEEDVRDECAEYGTVEGVCIPVPPRTMPPSEPGRAYIMFGSHEEATKAKPVFDGRLFDDGKVTAKLVPDDDFQRAAAGEWIHTPMPGGLPAHPGVYTTGPLTINISGVAALNPAMAGQVQTNPALAGLMYGSINEAAVPIEEGWVKLRGLDPAITKQDICTFFERCAEMQPEEVRIVKGVDERLTGEAYVHISGARSKLRLALAKDRTLMPANNKYQEVFTSSIDELDRRILMQGVSYE